MFHSIPLCESTGGHLKIPRCAESAPDVSKIVYFHLWFLDIFLFVYLIFRAISNQTCLAGPQITALACCSTISPWISPWISPCFLRIPKVGQACLVGVGFCLTQLWPGRNFGPPNPQILGFVLIYILLNIFVK